jgi:hypothetical protein
VAIPSYDEYVATLSRLTEHVDPTTPTAETAAIKMAAESLAAMGPIDVITLERWTRDNPQAVPVLGLTVGLSQEKPKNALKQHIGTTGWVTAARERPGDIVAMLDTQFGLVESLKAQTGRTYSFGDVLVARAGDAGDGRVRIDLRPRVGGPDRGDRRRTWTDLQDPHSVRGTFRQDSTMRPGDTGRRRCGADRRGGRGVRLDRLEANRRGARSREMAEVRKGNQTVMAAIDGVGWLSRANDLRKIHTLWANGEIDGMYTVSTPIRFKTDLGDAARFKKLI